MSAATEIANAEADEVEAELGPDEELEPDGETEQELEPEVEQESEASMQARLKKISSQMDGEDKRHEKRYAEILGDDFGMYAPCPLCQLAGFAFTYPPGSMPEEQRAAVAVVLGESASDEMETLPYAVKCEICNGFGKGLTGAKTEHGWTAECRRCKSKGWYDPNDPETYAVLRPAAPPTASTSGLALVPGQPPTLPVGQLSPPVGWVAGNGFNGNDNWGRWPGHPRHGIDTQYSNGEW